MLDEESAFRTVSGTRGGPTLLIGWEVTPWLEKKTSQKNSRPVASDLHG
jgi:hypothetical protein